MSRPADRLARQFRYLAGRARKAKTPTGRAAAWFDGWRGRVRSLPSDAAAAEVERLIEHFKSELHRLAPGEEES